MGVLETRQKRMAASLRRIRGVLFDYRGTLALLHSDRTILTEIMLSSGHTFHPRQISRALEAFRTRWNEKYSTLPRGKRWTEAIRIDCHRAALAELGLKDNLDHLATHVNQSWLKYGKLRLGDDVTCTLNVLCRLGVKMGVLSQNPYTSSELREELESLQIAQYFQLILTSEDCGYDKPDRRLFLLASHQIGIHPSALCYVGNEYDLDIVGARSAGMNAILLDRVGRGNHYDCLQIETLRMLPDVVRRFNET
jgi:HAD superfamily hydrolase (TIGR01549 family)